MAVCRRDRNHFDSRAVGLVCKEVIFSELGDDLI